MPVKPTIDEIAADVDNILATKFAYTNTTSVPYDSDSALSYEGGDTKWGKTIQTCVLYVDIRSSVRLGQTTTSLTMGKLYTAFIKSVIKVARYHNGHTRNITGDRVMVVFDAKDCYTNAVKCAISINHIAREIINVKFKTLTFKCGIGIDFGLMKVIKVGVPRKGDAANANRGLVWVGNPANLASRLTDMGSKVVSQTYYEVIIKPYNIFYGRGHGLFNYIGPSYGLRPANQPTPVQYLNEKTVTMSEKEFMQKLRMERGQLFSGQDLVINFEKKTKVITHPPILITKRVLDGLSAEKIDPALYRPMFWQPQSAIKDVDVEVFGNASFWKI